MFLFDWIRNILQYFGLVNKKVILIIMGLDNAGKSTFLRRIRDNDFEQHQTTSQVCMEEFSMGEITFQAYDIGARFTARRVWQDYFSSIDGIVFMVDATEIYRMSEARKELIGIMTDDEASNVPILVLGNKIDRPNCYSKEELIQALGIGVCLSENLNPDEKPTKRPCTLVMCSVVKMIGYGEGLKWMANQIQ